jgi:RimJ/RimL family protein N-acetyltransferase
MITVGNSAEAQRIAKAAGIVYNPNADQCLVRVEDGELYGGTLYTNYTGEGGSIQIHMAGFTPNWANRDMIWTAFDYPFNQLKVKKVFGPTRASNTTALEINEKLGFKIETKVEGVFPDEACYVLAIAREDCRWLKLKPRTLKSGKEA